MSETQRPDMSAAEREVLKSLWDHGPLSVKQALAQLEKRGLQWARSTVITLLQRLEAKGYVASDKSRFAFVFRPLVTREEEMHNRLADLATELCDGDPLSLVLAFTERHRFSANELANFRKMIDKLEPKRSKRGQK